MQQAYTVDSSEGTISGGTPWSDPTYQGSRTATANPNGGISASFGGSHSDNTATIYGGMASSNPLFPVPAIAAAIDVKSTLKLTENLEKGILSVDATMTGDKYPAAEMFIGDTKGKLLMIIASPFEGTPSNLIFDNNRQMGAAKFDIKINDKGEFLGVVVGIGKDAKTFTVEQWNKMLQDTQLEEKPRALSPKFKR